MTWKETHKKKEKNKTHPKLHYKSKRQIEIPDYKSILNNWGLSFNFMNWGRTKSFAFCANSVFHPWWWLLVLGIKRWEFLLKTQLWHLWPWIKSQKKKKQVGAAFSDVWGSQEEILGSFSHNLRNAGEKLILGKRVWNLFFFCCFVLIFPAAALCSPDSLCRCRKQRMARSEPLMRGWGYFLMSCTTSISCIFFPSLMAFRLVIGIKHCELK